MIKYQVVLISSKGERRKWLEPYESMTKAQIEAMTIEEVGRQENWDIKKIEIVPVTALQIKAVIGGN